MENLQKKRFYAQILAWDGGMGPNLQAPVGQCEIDKEFVAIEWEVEAQ